MPDDELEEELLEDELLEDELLEDELLEDELEELEEEMPSCSGSAVQPANNEIAAAKRLSL